MQANCVWASSVSSLKCFSVTHRTVIVYETSSAESRVQQEHRSAAGRHFFLPLNPHPQLSLYNTVQENASIKLGFFIAGLSLWFHGQEESLQPSERAILALFIWTLATHRLQSWGNLSFFHEFPRIRLQSLVGSMYPEQHFLGVMRWLREWVSCKTWGDHACSSVLEKQRWVAGGGEGDAASVGAPCTPGRLYPSLSVWRPIAERCYVYN